MASANESKWLDTYIATGDAHQATREVFPDVGKTAKDDESAKNSLVARTSQLKSKLQAEMQARLNIKLTYGAASMLSVIKDLAGGKEVSDSVRLGAAKDWLDRAKIGTQKEETNNNGIQIVINNQPVSGDAGQIPSVTIDVAPEE